MPLAQFRPIVVPELILRVGSENAFRINPRQQEPQHQNCDDRSFADAMASAHGMPGMLAEAPQKAVLPRLKLRLALGICYPGGQETKNASCEPVRAVPRTEPRQAPRLLCLAHAAICRSLMYWRISRNALLASSVWV